MAAVQRKRDANWSELEGDVLECVLRKLSFAETIRVEMVCTSWFAIAESYLSSSFYNPYSQTPWLMLSHCRRGEGEGEGEEEGEEDDGLCFFNLDEKTKIYKNICTCEEIYNEGRCVGSSHGWLLLLGKDEKLVAFNPLSGVRIRVASLNDGCMDDPFIVRAVLVSDPHRSKDKNLGVVVIHGFDDKLAVCRHKDGKFIELEGSGADRRRYRDVISCNNNNDQVYALSRQKNREANVEVWDFSGSHPTRAMDMKLRFPSISTRFYRRNISLCWPAYYLVESGGELLFVMRFERATHDGDPYRTMLFHVYRLDRLEQKWVKVETLGDRLLFIDENHAISLKSGDCGGGDFIGCHWDSVHGYDKYRGVGVYSLETASVKPFYDGKIQGLLPFWFVPNPCKF